MEICDNIGLSATSACLVFIKKVVNEQKIPFELAVNEIFLNDKKQKETEVQK